ncbi:hypothetical protein HPB47_019071 [Ixodes persulcatus]|uniref:Uncharacterized protein n=1 Tax=Ixodes persulcatus TaxID=34615 RepID=A0AC60QJZ9_IXOPE|nr:hypothetical protein HPB47_019071 [Ixodes persulcatus]
MQRQPGGNRQFREWSNITAQCTEVLWNQVRPTLPTKKKTNAKEGTVVVLGEQLIPEKHKLILQRGPKFCFEPVLNRVEKLRISRSVSRQVPEEEKPRCIAECVDVMASTEGVLCHYARIHVLRESEHGGAEKLSTESPKTFKERRVSKRKNPSSHGCTVKHGTPFVSCTIGAVYRIPFTCGRVYIGQTGRCLNIRTGGRKTEMHSGVRGLPWLSLSF